MAVTIFLYTPLPRRASVSDSNPSTDIAGATLPSSAILFATDLSIRVPFVYIKKKSLSYFSHKSNIVFPLLSYIRGSPPDITVKYEPHNSLFCCIILSTISHSSVWAVLQELAA